MSGIFMPGIVLGNFLQQQTQNLQLPVESSAQERGIFRFQRQPGLSRLIDSEI